MRILITGAAGLVGSALARLYEGQRKGAPHAVRALRHHDLDIADPDAVRTAINDFRPDILFNCAVIGVDDCERDPSAARAVNVDGPAYLAEAAARYDAAMVHFSTNYVFHGGREKFYTIEDEPAPVNVYGQTKWQGERAVADRCSQSWIIRTSWVFGSGKDNFLSTVATRLRRGERVKAINDVWASTTSVLDLVARVAAICDRGSPGTWQVANGGVCSYADFAREAARIVEADESLIEETSEGDAMRSPRPRYTPMRCLLSERHGFDPLRSWQDALAEYATR
jgi:dTDP-4-dehydrorhamnose reductase